MSEEEKKAANQETENVETSAETEKPDKEHMIPKSRLDEEIKKRKDLQKRLDAIDKANREAEERRLKEAEDYKGLYEKAVSDLNEVKPKAEKAESYQETIEKILERELQSIPEDRRSLIPDELSADAKLSYITRNRALLSKAKAFDIGAGHQGGGADDVTDVSTEEREVSAKLGVPVDQYAKNKKSKN